jgi:hypothetical protein
VAFAVHNIIQFLLKQQKSENVCSLQKYLLLRGRLGVATIPESMRLLTGGGGGEGEGGGGERDGNSGVTRGEQWGGDGGGIQLHYCDGAVAHQAAPCQYHQISATHTQTWTSSVLVVLNLWQVYPWGYMADRLGVQEHNIGNGRKH